MLNLPARPLGRWIDVRRDLAWDDGEIRRQVAARAGRLAANGLTAGDAALLAHGGTPACLADLFAVWACGATAIAGNPNWTADEFATVRAHARPRLTLIDGAPPAGIGAADPTILDAGADGASADPGAPGPARPALVLYTSGTTGRPKAVALSARAIAARIALNIAYMGGLPGPALCVLPSHFGHGLIGNALTPIFAGVDLALWPEPGVAEGRDLPDVLARHAIAFMSSVPAFWKLAFRLAAPPRRHRLARVHIGSAPLSADLLRQVADWTGATALANMYGLTECANWTAGALWRPDAGDPPADGEVGTMWGGDAAILGPDGRPAGSGRGEILLRNPALMDGYWRDDAASRDAFIDGYYRSGDSGELGPDGRLRLTGRLKDEINRAGQKVQPAEIDLLLERHPKIAEACVFALPDPVAGERVAAAVAAAPGATLDQGALRAWCIERVRAECVPERWFFLPAIPKTDRGKVNRAAVRAACLGEPDGPI